MTLRRASSFVGAGLLVVACACVARAAGPGAAVPADAPVASPGAPAGGPGPSDTVILVSLDTTRADAFGGAYGNPLGLTPNLDAFAKDAVVFADAWSVSNLTSMAHAGVFTSRYPSEVGIVGGEFHLDGRVTTLADLFHLYGWQTAAFTSGGHLTRSFGLDRGFDSFAYTPFQGSLWHTVPAGLDWLDHTRKPGPAMLFMHGYDGHCPYLAPAPFGRAWMDLSVAAPAADQALATPLGSESIFGDLFFSAERMIGFLARRDAPRLWDAEARAAVRAEAAQLRAKDGLQVVDVGPADVARVRAAYDGAMAYQDAIFGELIAGLKRRGLYDNAWIVVFADHGEALGEEGRFGHGESLSPAELHVPLFVHAPGVAARVVNAPVSLLDVLPTLADAFAFTPPAQAQGVSLLPWLRGEEGPRHVVRFAEGSVDEAMVEETGAELVFEGMRPGSAWFSPALHAASVTGPAFREEGRPLSAEEREHLREAMETWRTTLTPLEFAEPASKEAVEAMKARGYFTP